MKKFDTLLASILRGEPIVMGILNVTPDSFSDGGRFFDAAQAIEHAYTMAREGAAIIDIGAESTRPRSSRVEPQEQIRRLSGVLPALVDIDAVVSIDTTSADVAEFAISHGASIINDVSAGREDPRMLTLAATTGSAIALMHMLGDPATMQQSPVYDDVVEEVGEFLRERVRAAQDSGIEPEKCIVDPGIGFGKTIEHNLTLLANMDRFRNIGVAVMVGVSRKRFIGTLTGKSEPEQRLCGTVAACIDSWNRGANIFRVHDVDEVAGAFAVCEAIAQKRIR